MLQIDSPITLRRVLIHPQPETGQVECTYRVTPQALHPNRDLVVASFARQLDIKDIMKKANDDIFLRPSYDEITIDQVRDCMHH